MLRYRSRWSRNYVVEPKPQLAISAPEPVELKLFCGAEAVISFFCSGAVGVEIILWSRIRN